MDSTAKAQMHTSTVPHNVEVNALPDQPASVRAQHSSRLTATSSRLGADPLDTLPPPHCSIPFQDFPYTGTEGSSCQWPAIGLE